MRSASTQSTETIIDLLPVGQRTMGEIISSLLHRAAWAAVTLIAVLIVLRLGGALWLASGFSEAVERSAAAGDWDASITAWLKDTAALGFGVASVGLLARVILGFLVPLGSTAAGAWKPMVVLLGASGLGVATPAAIQKVRGLGPDNLPVAMQEVDPESSIWFAPSGEALIFHADHLDGTRRFWNRPGHTPRDSSLAVPVTVQTHVEWLRAQLQKERDEAAAQREEEARQATLKAEAEKLRREDQRRQEAVRAARTEEAQRYQRNLEVERTLAAIRLEIENAELKRAEEERKPTEAAPAHTASVTEAQPSGDLPVRRAIALPENPVQRFDLPWGAVTHFPVHGDAVEIWSNGPMEAAADSMGFDRIPMPNQRLRFHRGLGTIHVHPLHPSATTIFIQKID